MEIKAAQTKRIESKNMIYIYVLHVIELHHNRWEFCDSTSNLKFSPPFINSHRVE